MCSSASGYCSMGAERFKRCNECEYAGNAFDIQNNSIVYLTCKLFGGKWTAEISDEDCPKMNGKEKSNV